MASQRNRWIWLGAVLVLIAVAYQQIYDLAWDVIRAVWDNVLFA